MRFTDNSIMPYGKYQGRKLTDVPVNYLIWLYDNGKCSPRLNEYVEANIDALRKQASEAARLRDNRDRMRSMYK